MATKLGGDDSQPISDINVTPFVDIILVVLIIFMVTTPIIMNPSVKINLPKAASGEDTVPSQLNISIQKTGEIFLNGKASTINEVATYVKQTVAAKPELQAIISADAEVAHGKVIEVIDAVKTSGVTKFAISIEKK